MLHCFLDACAYIFQSKLGVNVVDIVIAGNGIVLSLILTSDVVVAVSAVVTVVADAGVVPDAVVDVKIWTCRVVTCS